MGPNVRSEVKLKIQVLIHEAQFSTDVQAEQFFFSVFLLDFINAEVETTHTICQNLDCLPWVSEMFM